MLNLEMTDDGKMKIEAKGKTTDLLYQSTELIVNLIKLTDENFGKDLPNIDKFVMQQVIEELEKGKEKEKGEQSNDGNNK